MIDEKELIRRAKGGDSSAFRQLVEQNQPLVKATVYGMLGEVPEAEEVAQEVFIRFYRSIDQFKGTSTLSTYLCRISINLSLNEIKRRQQKRKKFPTINTENMNSIPDQSTHPSRFDNREAIYKLLNFLEPEFRSVIVLRLMDGYSVKETSEILDIPQGTVASRLARGSVEAKGDRQKMGDIIKLVKMKKEWMNLLLRSLDEDLTGKEQEQLEEALKISVDLQEEKKDLMKIRQMMTGFFVQNDNNFVTNVMNAVGNRNMVAKGQIGHFLSHIFPKAIAACVLVLLGFMIYIYLSEGSLDTESIVGIGDLAPEEVYSFLMEE